MISDSIADFLTCVRNAARSGQKKVDVGASTMRVAIADTLKGAGFIRNYKLFRHENKGLLRVYLAYSERGKSLIQGLDRISKPSRRVYVSQKDIPIVMNGIGMSVISTSKGILNDTAAREQNVGGEYICKVW